MPDMGYMDTLRRVKWYVLNLARNTTFTELGVLYSADLGAPALAESFGMTPLSIIDWTTVMSWALPILLVDEILKAVGRYVNGKEQKQRAKDAM